jgi:hypothetical protein
MSSATEEEILRNIVEEFVEKVAKLLREARAAQQPNNNNIVVTAPHQTSPINLKAFFDTIRPSALYKRLTKSQVEGHEVIILTMQKQKVPLSWAAYILATAYHETAKTMQPVREGLNASDAWRKKNLRYYPWYGRGHVQLTWERNYRRADRELGLGGALIQNPDLALDLDISAEILVKGMLEGWFSGDDKGPHTLARHLPNQNKATRAQFKNARRIVNLMDKADLIAGHALIYQEALQKAGYK